MCWTVFLLNFPMANLTRVVNSISFMALLIALSSCQPISQYSSNLLRKFTCSDKPATVLQAKDVSRISIDARPWNGAEKIKAGQQKGLLFQGKKGDKLRLQTSDPVCFWLYTPANDVLIRNDIFTDAALPVGGAYLLQIAGREDTSFKFSLSIRDLRQAQAVELVKRWLNAKPKIFGRPFDKNLVAQHTTGKLFEDITKPGGTIDALQKAKSYYTYAESRINQVWIFKPDQSRPLLKVEVVEEFTLHTPQGIDPNNSGRSTSSWTYSFAENNGIWKISDYEKAK